MTSLLDRISIDPQVCFGKPCIKGTRIWVSLILDFLASGETESGILAAYPQLQPGDIRAALTYAAGTIAKYSGAGTNRLSSSTSLRNN